MLDVPVRKLSTTEIELSNGMIGFYCINKGVNIMILLFMVIVGIIYIRKVLYMKKSLFFPFCWLL